MEMKLDFTIGGNSVYRLGEGKVGETAGIVDE